MGEDTPECLVPRKWSAMWIEGSQLHTSINEFLDLLDSDNAFCSVPPPSSPRPATLSVAQADLELLCRPNCLWPVCLTSTEVVK